MRRVLKAEWLGDKLEMYTRLFNGYHSWDFGIFSNGSKKKLKNLLELRHKLIVEKD